MANTHCINCTNKVSMLKCIECNNWNNFNAIDEKGGKPNVTKKTSFKKKTQNCKCR